MKFKPLFISLIFLVVWNVVALAQPHPSQLWQDTTLLYRSWDSALDTTNYTSAEKNRQRQINERLGHEWVLSYYPIQDAKEFGDLNQTLSPQERHIDFEDITPYTWKWILLRTPEGRIHLRRPNWWLKLHQVEKSKPLALSMPEMQLNVVGEVEQILPNLLDSRFPPAPRDGDYAWLPITAWMERIATEVWSYVFSSGDTIKATPNHPIFSKDRNLFKPIGEFLVGESTLTIHHVTENKLIISTPESYQTIVNNLEIWRSHNFQIGFSGILVHNACIPKKGTLSNAKTWKPTELNAQNDAFIDNLVEELVSDDIYFWTREIKIVFIKGQGYILDGHHTVAAIKKAKYSKTVYYLEVPLKELSEHSIYKTAEEVIEASKGKF